MVDSLSNQDVATKNYVDKHAFTTAGGVVSGDIKLNVGTDLVRSLGCNDLTAGKKFTLLLVTDKNVLSYSLSDSALPVPVKIKTDGGFAILINQLAICDFGQDLISWSQPIDMEDHLIKNVKNPVNKFDAVNKAYADCIKYKTATCSISNTAMTDHTLFTFSAAKAFASGNKNMWNVDWTVERWGDCNIKFNVSNCVAWLSQVFPRSVPYDILHCLPASGWTRDFRLDYIELPWGSLNDYNHNIIENFVFFKASNNTFKNHYHFFFKRKHILFINVTEQAYEQAYEQEHAYEQEQAYEPKASEQAWEQASEASEASKASEQAYEPKSSIHMLMNKNQAYLMLMSQKWDLPTT